MLVFSIILIIILLIPDAYIIFVVMKPVSWWWKGLFLLPTVVYIIFNILLYTKGIDRQTCFNWVFWLTLCLVLPVLIFSIISIIGQGTGILYPKSYSILNWVGFGVATVWLGMAIYGISFGWRNVTIESVDLHFPNLPENFKNYKIVQMSDLHIGTYDLAPSTVNTIVEKVNSLHADLIVFTGDIVNMDPEELNPYMNVLRRLKATDGIVSVLGNHDYCLYKDYRGTDDSPAKALARVIEKERQLGWKILLNQSIQIKREGEAIAIVGVENSGGKNFIDRSDLDKALKGLPEQEFKILLSHDPSHWRREVLNHSNIDLTLSGHTHAMQFKVGNFSPSKWTYKEWGGIYEEQGRVLHVNTGTGGNIAFRFGADPQITLITLLQ